ncbi:MAG: transposase [Candidatus Uhrbacteria bacterium]|nr:transposase [Candidatus Uhrbacteria bacterium]
MRSITFVNDCYYHVYNRGVDRRSTFVSDDDRRRFVRKLEEARNRLGKRLVEVVAFVLMPNHFHLLLKQVSDGGISLFMQKLGTAYTQYFNHRHDRTGSLFGSTFLAKFIKDTEYLLYLSRYIHRNPLEIVGNTWMSLAAYRWSSLSVYLEEDMNSYVHCKPVMNCFDSASDYRGFMRNDQEKYLIDDDFLEVV